METLTNDLFHCIANFLKDKEVIASKTVCIQWKSLLDSDTIWKPRVERLWENKVFIPEHSQQLKNAKQYRRAFETSVIDATRNSITEEELTKLGWHFRFKHTAGAHWTHDDDYWRTGKAVEVKFCPDGTMVRDLYDMQFRWQRAVDGKSVRVNGFPAYLVWRHPKNWGFVMESCWVLYTSFPMPKQEEDEYLKEEHLRVSCIHQEYEIIAYNNSFF